MPFDLIRQLAQSAAQVHPDPGVRDVIWRLKYCLRGLAHARFTRQWFTLLARPELRQLTIAHPHVLSKLQRPYLFRTLGVRQRFEALKSHYCFVAEHLSQEMMREVYAPNGFLLTSIPVGETSQLDLRLVYRQSFCKEGELTVWLEESQSRALVYSLTFSIVTRTDGTRLAFVGGLQGSAPIHDDGRVVSMTRAMHGLRPKALVVFALQQLASEWECKGIRAVSDRMHIYQHFIRRKRIAAHYNEFWVERGGNLGADGLFDLPLEAPVRPLSEVKVNKRQMYRRRYALLDQLAEHIRVRLRQHYKPATLRETCIWDNTLASERQNASRIPSGGGFAARFRRKLGGFVGLPSKRT